MHLNQSAWAPLPEVLLTKVCLEQLSVLDTQWLYSKEFMYTVTWMVRAFVVASSAISNTLLLYEAPECGA